MARRSERFTGAGVTFRMTVRTFIAGFQTCWEAIVVKGIRQLGAVDGLL